MIKYVLAIVGQFSAWIEAFLFMGLGEERAGDFLTVMDILLVMVCNCNVALIIIQHIIFIEYY